MMQALNSTNVKPLVNPELINKAHVPTPRSEAVKAQEVTVESVKQPNYSRMFEAFSDCV
jgi:hypothetical protein